MFKFSVFDARYINHEREFETLEEGELWLAAEHPSRAHAAQINDLPRQTFMAIHQATGRTIRRIGFGDLESSVVIHFTDGSRLVLADHQSCCESRWMTTDDDVDHYKGSAYLGYQLKPGPDEDQHETAFLEIQTSIGSFTVVTHNEHNGYYGGFNISPRLKE